MGSDEVVVPVEGMRGGQDEVWGMETKKARHVTGFIAIVVFSLVA